MSTIPPSQSTSSVSSAAQTLGYGYLTAYIPDELLVDEILVRLPVKFLLRFRCVSKQWCSVIDSTKFVKRNIECNPNSGIIFRAYPDSKYFYLEDVDSLVESTVTEFDEPIKSFVFGTECVGSCNGLVCLWKEDKDVLLWNPAMRKARKLPTNDIPFVLGTARSSVVGFGYDHLNDDYKIVKTSDSQVRDVMVSFYSLKNNSWTQAEPITNRIRLPRKFGIYANGFVYWLADNDTHSYPGSSDSDFLFAFDLGVERHRELALPAAVVNKTAGVTDESGIGLFVFDRCLGLIDNYARSHTDIWLMNDNGVKNTWSKILSVEQPGMIGSFEIVWPVVFSKTRDEFLLLVDEEKFIWYDRVRNKVKNITVHGFPVPLDLLIYTESLVQLAYGFKSDGKQLKGSKQKRQKNNKMSDYLSTGFKLKL